MEFGGDGHLAVPRGERAGLFRACWLTDVAPVHERTELSRALRGDYAKLALKALIWLNATALPGAPLLLQLLNLDSATRLGPLRICLALFLSGLVAAVAAVMLSYITLDVDVVRQKSERSAARLRIVETEFAEAFSQEMAATLDGSILREQRFWRTGVALAWITAALAVASLLLFAAGGFSVLRNLP